MATYNLFAIDCDAQTCAAALGAANEQDQYCPENVFQSESNSIILVHPTLGTLVTNWGASLATTDFDIDNTDATDLAQKRFFGVGTLAPQETTETTVNDFQVIPLMSTFTLNFTIFDIGATTYDYFRKIQCGKVKPLLYFTSVSQKIFGSSTGINPSKFLVKTPLESGQESLMKLELEISWSAKTSPDMYDSPLP